MQALAFVDSYNAVLANAFHGVSKQVSDGAIVVCSDASDVGHFGLVFDLDRHLAKLFGDVGNGGFDTALHLDWIDASYDSLEAFVEDGFSHDGCGRGSVTSNVARLGRDFANHSSAHVFVDVFQVDFLGDGHTVLGDGWATKALLKDNVTTARSEGDFDRAGQFANSATNRFAGFLIESNNLCH